MLISNGFFEIGIVESDPEAVVDAAVSAAVTTFLLDPILKVTVCFFKNRIWLNRYMRVPLP